MKAYLYYNKSDKRYVSKKLDPITYDGGVDYIDVEFKEPTNLIDPSFILRAQSRALEANYIYVPDLGRYYYINDCVMSHQRLVINCHVDVLMSFWNQIKTNKTIINRNEIEANLYLNDDRYECQQRTAIRVLEFPATPFNWDIQSFVMGVVGNNS